MTASTGTHGGLLNPPSQRASTLSMLFQKVAIPLCTAVPPLMTSHACVLNCGTPCKTGPIALATTFGGGSANFLLMAAGFPQPGSIKEVSLRSLLSWDNTSAWATSSAFTDAKPLDAHAHDCARIHGALCIAPGSAPARVPSL